MKKSMIIMFFLMYSFCNGQQNNWITVPLEEILNTDYAFRDYAYFKDVNNSLDKFVGTWIYNQGNDYFKITFTKLENVERWINTNQKEDILISKYEYKKNGIIVFETYSINKTMVDLSFIINSNKIDLSYTEPSFTHCRKQRISDLEITYSLNLNNQSIITWNRIDKPVTQKPIPCQGSTTSDVSDFLAPANMTLVKQ